MLGRHTDRLPGGFLRSQRHPAVPAPLVGLEHPGRAAAQAAIQKELDTAGSDPGRAGAAAKTLGNQPGQVGHGRVKEYAKAKQAFALQAAKGLENPQVLHVLNSGDSSLVRRSLGLQERVAEHGGLGVREDPANQIHRVLEQDAGRVSTGIPHDAAALGVGSLAGDVGPGHRHGVYPRGVDIEGVEEDRLRAEGVEGLAGWRIAPVVRVPSLAANPALARAALGNPPHRLGHGRRTGQVHLSPLHGPLRKMGVGVDEPRGQHRPRHLEDGRARVGLPRDLPGGSDGPYHAIHPEERVRMRAGRDDAVHNHQSGASRLLKNLVHGVHTAWAGGRK